MRDYGSTEAYSRVHILLTFLYMHTYIHIKAVIHMFEKHLDVCTHSFVSVTARLQYQLAHTHYVVDT